VDRFVQPEYVASDEDILAFPGDLSVFLWPKSIRFLHNNKSLSLYDVNMKNMDTILDGYDFQTNIFFYTVDLTRYDEIFYVRNMLDGINNWIRQNSSQFVLIFTFCDIFIEKSQKVSFTKIYKECTTYGDPYGMIRYFVGLFIEGLKSSRGIPALVINCIDEKLVKKCFDRLMNDMDFTMSTRQFSIVTSHDSMLWKCYTMTLRHHLVNIIFRFE
jgi:hypothetical protein